MAIWKGSGLLSITNTSNSNIINLGNLLIDDGNQLSFTNNGSVNINKLTGNNQCNGSGQFTINQLSGTVTQNGSGLITIGTISNANIINNGTNKAIVTSPPLSILPGEIFSTPQ